LIRLCAICLPRFRTLISKATGRATGRLIQRHQRPLASLGREPFTRALELGADELRARSPPNPSKLAIRPGIVIPAKPVLGRSGAASSQRKSSTTPVRPVPRLVDEGPPRKHRRAAGAERDLESMRQRAPGSSVEIVILCRISDNYRRASRL
jgi:hypothetical protein